MDCIHAFSAYGFLFFRDCFFRRCFYPSFLVIIVLLEERRLDDTVVWGYIRFLDTLCDGCQWKIDNVLLGTVEYKAMDTMLVFRC